MYWQLAVVALAAMWILHRVYVLATMPIDNIVKTLNVDIPRAARLSVDSITDTAVQIHWDRPGEENEQKITHFLLFINGRQVQTLSRRDIHCSISRLNPSTKYRIDLVTVNYRGYKAKSRPVFIKTKSKELQSRAQSVLLEKPETLFKLLTGNSDLSIEKISPSTLIPPPSTNGETQDTGTPTGRAGRSRSNTVNSAVDNASVVNPSLNMMPDPRSINEVKDLRFYLESRQEELHNVLNQQSQAYEEFQKQETLLKEEIAQLQKRKKLEDGNRQSTKSEIKMLDDSKASAILRKSKQMAQLQTKKKTLEKMQTELDEWNRKIEEFELEKSNFESSEDKVHQELDADIKIKQEKVSERQAVIASLENEMKQLLSLKKQREQQKPQLLKILKEISRNSDSSGLLNAEGVQNLELLRTLDPEIYQRVNDVVQGDAQLEARWRAEQQRAASNCEKANNLHRSLLQQNEALKNNSFSQLSSGTPPSDALQPVSSGQALPSLSNMIPSYNAISQSLSQSNNTNNNNTSSSSNSFVNNSYFPATSPPNGSASLNSSSQQPSIQPSPSPWNNTLSLGYKSTPTPKLSLSTNLRNDFAGNDDLDSPLLDHLLPTNLIGEEMNDILFPTTAQGGSRAGSDGVGTGQSSTPKNNHESLLSGSGASFNPNLNLNGDFGALSQRSLLYDEFGVGSQTLRQSLDNPSSPPQSFNAFLSASNSPAPNTDLASLFSGGTGDVMPTYTQPSAVETNKTTHKRENPFSPRRLSTVLGFGKKNTSASIDPSEDLGSASASTSKHSLFFHGSRPTNTRYDSPPSTEQSFIKSADSSAYLDLWGSSALQENGGATSRNQSMTSDLTHPMSEDAKNSGGVLGVPSSANSLSSQAISDAPNGAELGPTVQLIYTNKSLKSKSSIESPNASSTNTQSPGSFLRKKSNFFKFTHGGNSTNNNSSGPDKSPVKSSALLTRQVSPTKIDSHDDPMIEDYAPSISASNTPMRLFGKLKPQSNTRRQSNSSHEVDGVFTDQNSMQSSSSATNSSKLARKLSLFSRKSGNGAGSKDIGNIDEQANEETD